jgi:hypothetical protein
MEPPTLRGSTTGLWVLPALCTASDVKDEPYTHDWQEELANSGTELHRLAICTLLCVGVSMRQIEEVTTAIASAVEQQGAATREISQNVEMPASGTG